MRRPVASLVCLILPAAAGADELELGGFVETNHFVGVESGDLFDYGNTNVLGLKLERQIGEGLAVLGALELRSTSLSGPNTSSELGSRSKVEPLVVRLDEAYVDWFGLGLESLDVRAGKQQIIWGTADGFNPTSYLAPFNLENPLDFKDKLGVSAIQASLYGPWDVTLTGVVVPLFTPSLLPVDVFAADAAMPFDLPEGVEIGDQRDAIDLPETRIENVQVAAKLGWNLFDVDMSVSWFCGYQTLPALHRVHVYDFDISEAPFRAHVEARTTYPRTQAVGADLATSVFGVGLWAEGAVFFPERVGAEVLVAGLDGVSRPQDPLSGDPLEPIPVIDDEPYVKGVVGFDYTFTGGWYVNLQYIHGFFHEMTADALQDYGLLALRKSLFDDELKVQITAGGEMDDEDHLGWMAGGELAWHAMDSTRLLLGGLVARGDDGTTFHGFEGLEQVYLRLRADF